MSIRHQLNEAGLKNRLCKIGREICGAARFVFIRHEDYLTSGIPDISVTGRGKTTWWEIKLADPEFDCPGVQELMLLRLANAGYARFLIYDKAMDQTKIVEPKYIKEWRTHGIACSGFDHKWAIAKILEAHQ